MLKKITTIISTNKNVLVRKAVVMGGVVLGIGIGLLLTKVEDPDMVIIEEESDLNDEADNNRWAVANGDNQSAVDD